MRAATEKKQQCVIPVLEIKCMHGNRLQTISTDKVFVIKDAKIFGAVLVQPRRAVITLHPVFSLAGIFSVIVLEAALPARSSRFRLNGTVHTYCQLTELPIEHGLKGQVISVH